jgi:hypothetical protein
LSSLPGTKEKLYFTKGRFEKENSGSKKQEQEEEDANVKEDHEILMKKKEEENPITFSNICTSRSSERTVYLVEELEMKTELPGCSGASRASSSSSPLCPTSTSSSESALQLLPPANLRSLSPTICNTNGSTLCAQYRQLYSADFLEREDDRNCG